MGRHDKERGSNWDFSEQQNATARDAWKSIQSSDPKGPKDSGIGLQDLEGCSGKASAVVLLGQAQVCLSTQIEKATRSERNSS